MRVKVDEDLPQAATEMLQARGYESDSVVGQGMGGAKDHALWLAVQAEQRFLVTADKGFGDIRFYPPGTHDLEALAGTVAVTFPRGIRIRRRRVED